MRRKTRSSPVSVGELERGNYLAQVFAVYAPPGKPDASMRRGRELVASFERDLVEGSRGHVRQARTIEDLEENRDRGVISAILSMEGAQVLGDDAGNLNWYATRGLRILGITWNNSNAFADGLDAPDPPPRGGLTPEGVRLLRLMETHQIVADLSHAHWETFWDIVTTIHGPVLATHSNARGVCNHRRNIDDEQLLAIHEKQGLIGLCLHSPFLVEGRRRAGAEDVLAHFRYIREIVGEGHLAFGADLGGGIRAARPVSSAGDLPELLVELSCHGLGREELEALSHGNFLRFWRVAGERYHQVPPLGWRPLLVEWSSDASEDSVLFDRRSSTGRRVCSQGEEGWSFVVTLECEAMPDSLAVRVRAPVGGVAEVSVEISAPDGGQRYGAGACPTDGSRCLIQASASSGTVTSGRFKLSMSARTFERSCLEVLDIVPIAEAEPVI